MNKNKYLRYYGQPRKLLAVGATWLTLACAVHAQTRGSVQKKVAILSETPSAGFQDNAILKGTKPSDIPVEQSTRFELVVNKKAAKFLEISLSQSILILAERVIE